MEGTIMQLISKNKIPDINSSLKRFFRTLRKHAFSALPEELK